MNEKNWNLDSMPQMALSNASHFLPTTTWGCGDRGVGGDISYIKYTQHPIDVREDANGSK
jgi:hypothetical protein